MTELLVERNLNVVVVTTFFPNSSDPNRTIFVKNLVQAMMAFCATSIISPIPYAPPFGRWKSTRLVKHLETVGDLQVVHPRYFVIPKLHWLSGFTYSIAIFPLLYKMKREHPDLIIHAHCGYPDGVGVALAANFLGLPYVITAHGSDINVYSKRFLLKQQMRYALRKASGVVAVSRDLTNKIVALVGRHQKNVTFIPCAGFDSGLFKPRPQAEIREALGLKCYGRVVVFVGQLVPLKRSLSFN